MTSTLTFAKSPLKKLGFVEIDVKSSIATKILNAQTFTTDRKTLEQEFIRIEQAIDFVKDNNNKKTLIDIDHCLYDLQDISSTLSNLQKQANLTDIELFEIKNLALTNNKIRFLISALHVVDLPDLQSVIDLLDPEHSHLPTFYIYDAYSPDLAKLRKQAKQFDEVPADLYAQIAECEENIRQILSQQLEHFTNQLIMALQQLAYLDILLAKAKQAIEWQLCKPIITTTKTSYKRLFNPQIKQALNSQHKDFQPIDIDFCQEPNLITGINMGGKTVLLKTIALAQYMCQFGFFVPAVQADIVLVKDILFSMEDGQDALQGLSSFAAEMKNINIIIQAVKKEKNILVLIDELAKTTNPMEGRAIVNAMIDILAENCIPSFVTTHYDNIVSACRRLRVKGLQTQADIASASNIDHLIDYTLLEDNSTDTPHEALQIAQWLQVDPILIEKAKIYCKK